MQGPLFSILIANFNNGHFFKDCYQSILLQSYTNWEVIIVDDSSTDDSLDVIRGVIKYDKRFRLFLNEENKGCGYTKNRCSQIARGLILGFLDPDDTLKPYAIELMVQNHIKDQNIAIVTSRYEFVDLKLNFIENGTAGSSIPQNKSYLTYGKGALTAFATFKKVLFDKTDGIDAFMKRAVDQDLYYKMEEQGTHLFIDKVLYCYRIHSGSISNNENLFKAKYWHFYAKLKASKRRKHLNLLIDNFTDEQISIMKSNFYLKRFYRIKHTAKYKAKCYFIVNSISAQPTHKVYDKLKAILLFPFFRRSYFSLNNLKSKNI